MKSRNTAVIFFAAFVVFVAGTFQFYGAAALKFWNIPTLDPPFADARIVTASAESFRLGFDPELENPRDPFGRRFNLPALWKLLFFTPINQSHTNALAGLLILSFIIGLLIFLARIHLHYGWLVALCAFSPPVMLAIERGNVDLFIFFVCALSLLLIERSGIASSLLLLLASGMKLFPVFGLGALMKYEKVTFLRRSAGIALALVFLLAFDISNLRSTFANTEIGYDVSYGSGVLPFYLSVMTGSGLLAQVANWISILFVLLIISICLIDAAQNGKNISVADFHTLAAFRLGAGIYVGTFLLENNWDYRLMFLLFTLPHLLEWFNNYGIARYTLIAILVSFAYLWIAAVLPFAYFIDEMANWTAFGGLLYLLANSAPDWLRSEIRDVVRRRTGKNPND